MANLSIRKLDPKIYEKLRRRASLQGVSMEESVRQLITQAVNPPQRVGAIFQQYFGENNGVELNVCRDKRTHQPVDFDA